MKNLGDLMKQAQQVQSRLAEAQEELANTEVTGESGGGLVRVTLNGRYEACRVQVDPSLVSEDRDLLEDLLAAAITDAARRVAGAQKDKMSDFARNLGLPPGFKLPF
ncbi:MAG: YbaB/EbfC family nucleoid-associated protein [Gammaproteobacteria bacterium]|nr:YbaB/EbfC family nucleoid-associated protein [Gammaproteobacteria bacterium]